MKPLEIKKGLVSENNISVIKHSDGGFLVTEKGGESNPNYYKQYVSEFNPLDNAND